MRRVRIGVRFREAGFGERAVVFFALADFFAGFLMVVLAALFFAVIFLLVVFLSARDFEAGFVALVLAVLVFLGIVFICIAERTAFIDVDKCGPIAALLYVREYLSFDAILFFAFSNRIQGKISFSAN